MEAPQREQIAARIRGLISGQDPDLTATARRLKVAEVPLRMSVDQGEPYPTIDVLTAVVRYYGVDPTWLLTGVYDAATHRKSLGADTAELPAGNQERRGVQSLP